jgi:hypothetical protein
MKSKKAIGAGLAGVAVLAVLCALIWLLSGVPDDQTRTAPASSLRAPLPIRSAAINKAQAAPTIALPDDNEQQNQHNQQPSPYEHVAWHRHTLLESDPILYEYRMLAEKVILDADERTSFHRLLQDTWLLERAKQDVLNPNTSHPLKQDSLKRLYQLDFLADAMAWGENPERTAVMDNLTSIIQTSIPEDFERDWRKSSIGDRIEAYAILRAGDPEKAAELRASLTDPTLRRAIDYAERRILDNEQNS